MTSARLSRAASAGGLVGLALVPLLLGGRLVARPAADEKPPTFIARGADGASIEGRLRDLADDGSARIGPEGRIAAGDLVSLHRTGMPSPPLPSEPHLILANGDRIPASGFRLDGERLRFRCSFLGDDKEVGVALSAVSVVWLGPAASEHPERLRRRLLTESRRRDVVLMHNGDVIEGVLTGLDDQEATLEAEKRPVKIDRKRIAAVALSTEDAQPPRAKGMFARVALTDAEAAGGARLTLTSFACKGAALTGTTTFGAAFTAPIDRLAVLEVGGGCATPLDDLKPVRYEYSPYLDERWDYVRDGAVSGLDLRLASSHYDRGLGLHAGGRLTYAVPSGARRFEATVGIDDRAGEGATARVRLLADGKAVELGDSKLTRGAPRVVRADVAGAKELTLEVEYGPRGPVHAHVDWVDARFVK
jgi:hypothetical protein